LWGCYNDKTEDILNPKSILVKALWLKSKRDAFGGMIRGKNSGTGTAADKAK
jgi:hypothetical protein